MIVLPVGHEQGSVRRLPWVTFSIMGLCLVVLMLVSMQTPSSSSRAAESLQRLRHHYMNNPHVALSQEAEDLLFQGMNQSARESIREASRGQTDGLPDAEMRQADQAVFDGLVAAVQRAVSDHPFYRWGLVPGSASIVTLMSHMFLHAGWLHLLGNLLILYLAGPFIEDVYGRPLYVGFYLGSGAVAALTFALKNPGVSVPLVGASGAIAGVMGAFLVRYWSTHIHFIYIVAFVHHGSFSAPAWMMLPMWFLEQLVMTNFADAGASGGVAYSAHVGGFAFGTVAALALRHFQVVERFIQPAIEAEVNPTVVENTALEKAMEARGAGDGDTAWRLLSQLARQRPGDSSTVHALWQLAREQGRAAAAAPLVMAHIHAELRHGEMEFALPLWSELVQEVPAPQAAPALLLRLAEAFRVAGDEQAAAAVLRLALLDGSGQMTSSLALRLAHAAQDLDPVITRGAARWALARPDLSDSERTSARQLLAAAGSGGGPRQAGRPEDHQDDESLSSSRR